MKRIAILFFVLFFASINLNAADVTVAQGNMRIMLYEKSGTFAFYSIDADKKEFPLLSTYANSQTSAFSLKVGDRVYRLAKKFGITVVAAQTDKGASFTYTIKDVAEVVVMFSFVESFVGNPADTIKIDVTVTSKYPPESALGIGGQNMSVKVLFDTVLGEMDDTFFATKALPTVTSELRIASIPSHVWVKMEDPTLRMYFLLSGPPSITQPESVLLANKDILTVADWEPVYHPGRSFSSRVSYDNAAVGIWWKAARLLSEETDTVSFFLTQTTNIDAFLDLLIEAYIKENPSYKSDLYTGNISAAGISGGGAGGSIYDQFTPDDAGINALYDRLDELEANPDADPAEIDELYNLLDELLYQMENQ